MGKAQAKWRSSAVSTEALKAHVDIEAQFESLDPELPYLGHTQYYWDEKEQRIALGVYVHALKCIVNVADILRYRVIDCDLDRPTEFASHYFKDEIP